MSANETSRSATPASVNRMCDMCAVTFAVIGEPGVAEGCTVALVKHRTRYARQEEARSGLGSVILRLQKHQNVLLASRPATGNPSASCAAHLSSGPARRATRVLERVPGNAMQLMNFAARVPTLGMRQRQRQWRPLCALTAQQPREGHPHQQHQR